MSETERSSGDMPAGVDGLVAEVEKKMSELMGWHEQQTQTFASEKGAAEEALAQREAELERAQQEAEQAKERYREKAEQTDQQRDRLRQAAEALSQRQQALQEEWAAATQARDGSY